MSNRVLDQLEKRIDEVIETMEILRLQIEELEVKNAALENENHSLKTRQSQWEQGLNTLLSKLEDTPNLGKPTTTAVEYFTEEDVGALI